MNSRKKPASSRVYYHVTQTRLVPSILRDGLRTSENKDKNAYAKYKSRVYLFNDHDRAIDFISVMKGPPLNRKGPFTVLEIVLPTGVKLTKDREDVNDEWGSYWTRSPIPSNMIRVRK